MPSNNCSQSLIYRSQEECLLLLNAEATQGTCNAKYQVIIWLAPLIRDSKKLVLYPRSIKRRFSSCNGPAIREM